MDYRENAKKWLTNFFDVDTQNEVLRLMADDQQSLEESFYKSLEFGTGGLRGIMGVGTNRMNKYTVGMATQGFANYIKMAFPDEKVKVVVAYDSRNNSKFFAEITAEIFTQNGFQAYLFDDLRPTPELSFAIRELGCKAGVMVTASHNPKEYNGYKAYWEDGAQITAPHDTNIIKQVNLISDPSKVLFGDGSMKDVNIIGQDLDKKYLDSILSLTLSPKNVAHNKDMKIVYTPLHGTGVRLVPTALAQLGFNNIIHVPAQDISDGDFPTVLSPNPEEASALKMAVSIAEAQNADLVMATDPDADRIGIAVRNDNDDVILLNGNQTASILSYYILTRWKELGKLSDKTYMVKTIVTTELLSALAESFGVKIYDVLTGFKYIAEVVRKNEGHSEFICGGEESYGFNVGEFVRDKDAVIAASMIAECAAWAADKGMSLYDLLLHIYAEYGFYLEKLVSITKKGKEGVAEIAHMMKTFREEPPLEIAGSKVIKILDYLKPQETGLPSSNVLRFFTENGCVVSVRPSGTEPKIKFYFGVKGTSLNDAKMIMNELVESFK